VSPFARAEIIELRVICQPSALGPRKNHRCKMSPTLDGKCLDRTCAEKNRSEIHSPASIFFMIASPIKDMARVYLTLLRPNANDRRDVIGVNMTSSINPDYAYFVRYETNIGLPCSLTRATFGTDARSAAPAKFFRASRRSSACTSRDVSYRYA